ncbi:MAG TPA: UPF0149 family protein [Xanthomonadaceae bacterium]|jgi:hypothetical protein
MNGSEQPDPDLPDAADLGRALHAAAIAVDPSELHGALSGYVAGGGSAEAGDWLQRLQIEADETPDRGGEIDRLRVATLAQFAEEDFGFELLLPTDDAPISDRVDALLAWCRGFLGGFGLAAAPAGALSAEATEALQDIGRIAASDLSCEDSESDEEALAEIVEFVRVVPLLIHADCVRAAQRRRKAH